MKKSAPRTHILPWNRLTPMQVYELLRLRAEVFVKGQNCTCIDPDGKDPLAWHMLLHEGDELIGYARLFPPDVYKLGATAFGRVAVRKPWRGKGFGKHITRQSIDFLKTLYPDYPIVISAQQYLEKFYRDAGFQTVSEPYLEENMWHVRMRYD